jgi:predicted cobalt transporter CbtA
MADLLATLVGVLAAGVLVLLGIGAVVGMIFKDESYHDLNDHHDD